MITIIEYEDRFQPEFKRLNMEWLEKYGLVEAPDLEVLNDPRGQVLDKGGIILLAMDDTRVIATAGLKKEKDGQFELVKMSVAPIYRGQGVSKLMMDRCLEEARNLHASKIILFSNSQLQPAIRLYEKYGFKQVAVTDTSLLTADIKMELELAGE